MELVNSVIQIDFFLEIAVASLILLLYLRGWKQIGWKYPLVLGMEIAIVAIGVHFFHQNDDWGFGTVQQYVLCIVIFMGEIVLLAITNRVFGGIGRNMAFFLTFAAYLIEHTSHSISMPIRMIFIDGNVMKMEESNRSWIESKVILLICYLFFLLIEIYLLRKWKDHYHHLELKIKQLLPMSVSLAGFGLILNMATKAGTFDLGYGANVNQVAYWLFVVGLIYDLLCSIFMIWLQAITLNNQYLAKEVELERRLRNLQKQHFITSKTSIELINEKCHQLKHQIQELKEETDIDAIWPMLSQLEDNIMIYNAIVKTGNEVIDVAVNEKSLLCEREGITLTCMLDGRPFYAMETMDTYQLFKTVLEMATQRAEMNSEPEKRMAAITQSRQGTICFLQVECYFGENTKHTETNEDMKMLQEIAEKYDGEVEITVNDDIWMINIMLRLPELKELSYEQHS